MPKPGMLSQSYALWLWLQPSFVFTLAVTMLHGFLVPSQIHISPRRKRKWLTVALHFAVHSPQETQGLLTYPPGPLIFTQPLNLCHPQYGSREARQLLGDTELCEAAILPPFTVALYSPWLTRAPTPNIPIPSTPI